MLKRFLRNLALHCVRTVVPAVAILLVTMGVFPNAGWALTATEVQKLLASDGASNDIFGVSVSVSGDTALIGARGHDDNGSFSGSVYVFTRDATTGLWTEQAKLLASDGAAFYEFGFSVSVSGDTALIGVPFDDNTNGSLAGAAYVFTRDATTGLWAEQAKFLASDGAAVDLFGESVSVSGDTALIGARRDDDEGAETGSAYVFTRDGTVWTEQAKLVASDGAADDQFGRSVSVSGDTALIGAFADDDKGNASGSVYVFTRDGTVWTEQPKLVASDGASGDFFGVAVSVSGDTALIGAFGDDDKANNAGSAYVFTRDGTVWTEQAKLLASDGTGSDLFGESVSVSGDTALIGAKFDNIPISTAGSAYVFTRVGTVWTEQAKILASDAAFFDQFGGSVSVSGDTALIGAHLHDDNGSNSGSVYVFSLSDPVSLMNDLISVTLNLNLQNGISNSFDVKLDSALNALDDVNENNNVAAINALEAFINSVEAQSGGFLTIEEADALIESALHIIDLLSST